MSMAEFLGCFMISIGPVLILFIMTVAHDPLLIIFCIASAFFWMTSLLLSSAWWLLFDKIIFHNTSIVIFGVSFAVIFQELFRYILFRVMRKAEFGLKTVWRSGNISLNDHKLAYVAGVGFGAIHCIFNMVNLLAAMFGPGTAGLRGHSYDFFILSSFLATMFFLLNIFWGVIFFHGFLSSKFQHPLIVLISHMLTSCSTVLSTKYGVLWNLLLTAGMTLIMAIYTYKILGGSVRSFRESFKKLDDANMGGQIVSIKPNVDGQIDSPDPNMERRIDPLDATNPDLPPQDKTTVK